ncbi:MAG: FAD-dependent oxidoreductase [Bacteroidetes bacterium]|nr:FAD-dependent oxidoreductase [Bacteroidota bacterium]MCL5025151.1 FAD-dependent oxidoreductase [Chloroflexota bacterium]
MAQSDFDSIVSKDVVVIGGGTSGFPAAIAAARNGADTLLIERFHCLGGMMTGGLVLGFHTMRVHQDIEGSNIYQADRYQLEQVVRGLAMEILDRLNDMGGVYGLYGKPGEASSRPTFDPTLMKTLADQMIQEAGVEVWLDSLVAEPVMEGNRITGVVVYNKSGKHLVKAKTFVDCTGDADIVARTGAEFQQGREEDAHIQAVTMCFIMGGVDFNKALDYLEQHPEDQGGGNIQEWRRLLAQGSPIIIGGLRSLLKRAFDNGDLPLPLHGKGHVPAIGSIRPVRRAGKMIPSESIHVVDMAYNVDPTNTKDVTEALMFCRWYTVKLAGVLQKYLPGFENAYLIETAHQLGVRESRRIVGEYVLTTEDVLGSHMFDDAIARGGRALDIHAEEGGKPGRWIEIRKGKAYGIPYRCLVPKTIDNLLVAGRCISVEHMALGSVRGIPLCIATGQAAGTAAALSAKEGVAPRRVDIAKLRDTLAKQGADLGHGEPVFASH